MLFIFWIFIQSVSIPIVIQGFKQLMVIMIFNQALDTYVPIFFILLQSKDQVAYYLALQHAINASDWKLRPKTVSCDFEKGLLKAVEDEFRGTPEDPMEIIGCEFHFKQALSRKLEKLQIPKDVIFDLISASGLINILFVIPIEEIKTKGNILLAFIIIHNNQLVFYLGIPYIRSKFSHDLQYRKQFDAFWKYFQETWMITYDPLIWNVYRYRSRQQDLLNRTNNPCENFNSVLNRRIPPHPSMSVFVDRLKELSWEYVKMSSSIQRGRQRPSTKKPVKLPPLPADYSSWTSKK